jgi:hypothetical protein
MSGTFFRFDRGDATGGFLPVFTTTMLEGFIISFLLLMISFFALIVLQMRDRKKLHTGVGGTGSPR